MNNKPNIMEIDEVISSKLFSICVLASNQDQLDTMTNSAYNAGFTNSNSEYLYINNIGTNKYNAFDGLNQFLNKASGSYIILVHQDVEFKFDNIDVLMQRIDEMNSIDPNWAILGNTGYNIDNINKQYTRITDPGQIDYKVGPFPSKVSCIDENIMIVKNDLNLMFSSNIGHYHLYGADLCINAENMGYSTYVIDFHILHNSGGFPNKSFYDTKDRFIKQYQKMLKPKMFRTPCTVMFLSSSKILNFIMNKKFIYSLKKRYDEFNFKGEK